VLDGGIISEQLGVQRMYSSRVADMVREQYNKVLLYQARRLDLPSCGTGTLKYVIAAVSFFLVSKLSWFPRF